MSKQKKPDRQRKPELLLCIDLGTTHLKVAAFEPDGVLHHAVERRHVEYHDGVGRVQRAQDWWRLLVAAMAELLAGVDARAFVGLGLSGRGAAAIFLDADGEALNDVWFDRRHADALQSTRRELADQPSVVQVFAAKYEWFTRQGGAGVARACFAKDYLLLRLTDCHTTDWATGPDGPEWGSTLNAIPAGVLPRLDVPWAVAGTLTDVAALDLGLPAGLPVSVGAHDGLAANIGSGAVHPGDAVITMGTHAVVRATTAPGHPGAHHFYRLPGVANISGGNGLWAGRAVDWLLDLFDVPGEYELLEGVAVEPGANGVRFLPYLGGQVAPEVRLDRTASWYGLRLEHRREDLIAAVLEGTAYAIRAIFDEVVAESGPVNFVRLTGGGSRSDRWMRALAGALDRPLQRSDGYVEARGAAMCTAVALGLHGDIVSAGQAMARVADVIEPSPDERAAYATGFDAWRSLHD